MKPSQLPPIPTAFGQRLLEFRLVFLPVLVFGGALLLVTVLWPEQQRFSPVPPPRPELVEHDSVKATEIRLVSTNAPERVVNTLQHQRQNEPLHSGFREMSELKVQTATD